MARKKLNVPELVGSAVAVYWDSEWAEYRVTLKGCPEATYHTTDKADALSTAQAMRNAQGVAA